MSRDCCVALSCDVMGLSAVCDCGISLSYSLDIKLRKNGVTHLQEMVTLDFIFRLVQCSGEDDSFNSICLDVLEGIEQVHSLMWFRKPH